MPKLAKNDEANKLLPEFKKIDETFGNAELVCTKTDGTKYDFNGFSLPLKFTEKVHNYKITLNEAIDDQRELIVLVNNLDNDYNSRSAKKPKEKNNVLKSARKLLDARNNIIGLFFHIKEMYLKQKKKKNQK